MDKENNYHRLSSSMGNGFKAKGVLYVNGGVEIMDGITALIYDRPPLKGEDCTLS